MKLEGQYFRQKVFDIKAAALWRGSLGLELRHRTSISLLIFVKMKNFPFDLGFKYFFLCAFP